MAGDCMDRDGNILHFPRLGSWHDQNRLEIALMKTARHVRVAYAMAMTKEGGKGGEAKRSAGVQALGDMHTTLNTPTKYSAEYLLHYG